MVLRYNNLRVTHIDEGDVKGELCKRIEISSLP